MPFFKSTVGRLLFDDAVGCLESKHPRQMQIQSRAPSVSADLAGAAEFGDGSAGTRTRSPAESRLNAVVAAISRSSTVNCHLVLTREVNVLVERRTAG
jgi:hypothetical protein